MTGVHQGIVADTNDPLKAGRVRALIPTLFLDPETGVVALSPWLEAAGSLGEGAGGVIVPPKGAPIIVERQTGSDSGTWLLHYRKGRVGRGVNGSHLHASAQGTDGEAETLLKRGVPFSVPRAGALSTEGAPSVALTRETVDGLPGTMNDGKYPQVNSIRTPGGFILEADDTPGVCRGHIWHPAGVYLEVSDGGVMAGQAAALHYRVLGKSVLHVGSQVLRIDGAQRTAVGGDRLEDVAGKDIGRANEWAREAEGNAALLAGGVLHLGGKAGVSLRTAGDAVETVGGQHRSTVLGARTTFTQGPTRHVLAQPMVVASLGGPATFVGVGGGVPQPLAKAPAVIVHTGVLAGILAQLEAVALALEGSGIPSLTGLAPGLAAAATALAVDLVASADATAVTIMGA